MIQIETVLNHRVFADVLKSLFHGIKTDFRVLSVPIGTGVKDNLVMRHVIEHLEKHYITELPGLEVHDIVVNDLDLFVFEQNRVLS